jgi:hypothetical protein
MVGEPALAAYRFTICSFSATPSILWTGDSWQEAWGRHGPAAASTGARWGAGPGDGVRHTGWRADGIGGEHRQAPPDADAPADGEAHAYTNGFAHSAADPNALADSAAKSDALADATADADAYALTDAPANPNAFAHSAAHPIANPDT